MPDLLSAPSKADLRAALARIEDLKAAGARVLYDLGLVLRDVEARELWRASDAPSFSAWLEAEAGLSRTSARRAIAVAEHFNQEMAARFGTEKLVLGLRYAELTAKVEEPGDVVAMTVRCRDAAGKFQSVPFADATTRQLRDAISERQARRAQARAASVDERLESLSAALPPPPVGLPRAKQRVAVSRSPGGEVALTFRQIPLNDLPAFIAALQAMVGEDG